MMQCSKLRRKRPLIHPFSDISHNFSMTQFASDFSKTKKILDIKLSLNYFFLYNMQEEE